MVQQRLYRDWPCRVWNTPFSQKYKQLPNSKLFDVENKKNARKFYFRQFYSDLKLYQHDLHLPSNQNILVLVYKCITRFTIQTTSRMSSLSSLYKYSIYIHKLLKLFIHENVLVNSNCNSPFNLKALYKHIKIKNYRISFYIL